MRNVIHVCRCLQDYALDLKVVNLTDLFFLIASCLLLSKYLRHLYVLTHRLCE